MSFYYIRLCKLLIEECFGENVLKIAEVFMRKGPLTLVGIIIYGKIDVEKVQKAMKILLQHDLVSFSADSGRCEPTYTLHLDRVLNILRYSRYIAHAETKLGVDSRHVLEEIIRAGEVSLSKILYIFGCKLKKGKDGPTEAELIEKLSSYQNAFKSLVKHKFLFRCPDIVNEESELVPIFGPDIQNPSCPEIDLKTLCSRIINGIDQIDDQPDTDTMWRMNTLIFNQELRNKVIIEAMGRKFQPPVDQRIFQIIVETGLEKDPWGDTTATVTGNDIRYQLKKMENGDLTVKFLDEHFEIIEEDPLGIVYKTADNQGGMYTMSLKAGFTHLMWHTVERVVTERHGYFAARIFRLIKDKKYVEQDRINELGMIPTKEAKHLTYQLVEDHFITMKEVRKSYAVSAATNKVVYLFYIDINQVVYTLLQSCYKGIVNSKIRSNIENTRHMRLLAKEERLNRILANMSNQACTEAQLKEVRDMITPPERAVLDKVLGQTNKLDSGVFHIDETIFILQMYQYYTRPVRDSKGKVTIKKNDVSMSMTTTGVSEPPNQRRAPQATIKKETPAPKIERKKREPVALGVNKAETQRNEITPTVTNTKVEAPRKETVTKNTNKGSELKKEDQPEVKVSKMAQYFQESKVVGVKKFKVDEQGRVVASKSVVESIKKTKGGAVSKKEVAAKGESTRDRLKKLVNPRSKSKVENEITHVKIEDESDASSDEAWRVDDGDVPADSTGSSEEELVTNPQDIEQIDLDSD